MAIEHEEIIKVNNQMWMLILTEIVVKGFFYNKGVVSGLNKPIMI